MTQKSIYLYIRKFLIFEKNIKKKYLMEEDEIEYDDDNDYDNNNDEDNENKEISEFDKIFSETKDSSQDNNSKLESYIELISNYDISKDLKYKCYQEICLIYLQSEEKKENHDKFLTYLKRIMDFSLSFDESEIKMRIDNIMKVVFDKINQKSEELSIHHWVQDLINFPNCFDKELDMINRSIRDHIQEVKNEYKGKNIGNFYDDLMKYLEEKTFIDNTMKNYFLTECGCDEMYLDRKGDKYFCYAPENSERGGKKYEAPKDCIAYGLEVTERYGDDEDWLANDGRKEEWAVGYYGFGLGMNDIQIKEIIKTIIHDNIRPCSKQFFVDIKNNIETKGDVVYITPDLKEASEKAFKIHLLNKDYRLIIMVRVNPSSIIGESETENNKKYWIVEDSSQIRPYRILLKNNENKVIINDIVNNKDKDKDKKKKDDDDDDDDDDDEDDDDFDDLDNIF